MGVAKIGAVGLGALATGVGVVAKVTHDLLTEFADLGDELLTTSAQLGVGVEALQQFRYAAEFSDVSSEALGAGLGKLNTSMGKLKGGSGSLYTYLKRNSKELLGQVKAAGSTEEALTILVEALGRVEDPMKRAALAQAAFGGAGKEMLGFAEGGAAGLAKLRKESERYGNVTEEQAAKGDELNNQLARMGFAWRGVKVAIGSALFDAVSPYVEKLTEWVGKNRELVAGRVVEFIRGIGRGLVVAYEWGVKAFDAISRFVEETDWDAVKSDIVDVWEAIKSIGTAIDEGAQAVGGWPTVFGAVAVAMVGGPIATILTGIGTIAASAAVAFAPFFAMVAAYEELLGQGRISTAVAESLPSTSDISKPLVDASLGALSTRDLATRYVETGGARAYGALLDRGASNEDLRGLDAARNRSMIFDPIGRKQALDAAFTAIEASARANGPLKIDESGGMFGRAIAAGAAATAPKQEIVVTIDGLPSGASAAVKPAKGPAAVTANVGRRAIGAAP